MSRVHPNRRRQMLRAWTSRLLLAASAIVVGGPALTLAQEREPPRGPTGEQRDFCHSWIRVSDDARSFVIEPQGTPFTPWGFNYDHDDQGRLLEDYWHCWSTVAEDFAEMKELGANTVRVHLQTGKFMRSPTEPDAAALDNLEKLCRLAHARGLWLNITGLGCYHKQDVPAWYDALDEDDRWAVQCGFWEAVAERCATLPGVFCYDLMNEPVAPAGKGGNWLGPGLGDKHFVQRISLDQAGRPRPEIARAWIARLREAIRKHDQRRLITVGLVPWSLPRPGLQSGFEPAKIVDQVDFISVHLYPKMEEVDEAIDTLRAFGVGKPVLIEETFPLRCSRAEFDEFLRRSAPHAAGWLGFYWGRPLQDYQPPKTIAEAMMAGWLERFKQGPPLVPEAPAEDRP